MSSFSFTLVGYWRLISGRILSRRLLDDRGWWHFDFTPAITFRELGDQAVYSVSFYLLAETGSVSNREANALSNNIVDAPGTRPFIHPV